MNPVAPTVPRPEGALPLPRSVLAPGAATLVAAFSPSAFAATNSVVAAADSLPDAAGSVVRMLGGLAFVLALFFAGVWLFRNWQRVARLRNKSRLRVIEAQSLGPRQGLYVIGYEQQRFLVGASNAGVSLVSVLPAVTSEEERSAEPVVPVSFALLLQNALGRK